MALEMFDTKEKSISVLLNGKRYPKPKRLPDGVIQAGLPDGVIQAGLPDSIIQAGLPGWQIIVATIENID